MQAYSVSSIISNARQFTRTSKMSLAELLFIFSHTQLNEVEKILWIFLTSHSDENLYCTFSYAQLSFCLNIPTQNVHVALKRLIAMGFLDTEDLLDSFTPLKLMKPCRFSVQLPLEGLLALKKAPKLRVDSPKRKPITINLFDSILINAVHELERGLVDANLGGNLYKKRVATRSSGKSGGYRTLLAYKKGKLVFFLYGFEKNVRANINLKEEQALKELTNVYLELTDMQINLAILNKELVEVKDG